MYTACVAAAGLGCVCPGAACVAAAGLGCVCACAACVAMAGLGPECPLCAALVAAAGLGCVCPLYSLCCCSCYYVQPGVLLPCAALLHCAACGAWGSCCFCLVQLVWLLCSLCCCLVRPVSLPGQLYVLILFLTCGLCRCVACCVACVAGCVLVSSTLHPGDPPCCCLCSDRSWVVGLVFVFVPVGTCGPPMSGRQVAGECSVGVGFMGGSVQYIHSTWPSCTGAVGCWMSLTSKYVCQSRPQRQAFPFSAFNLTPAPKAGCAP